MAEAKAIPKGQNAEGNVFPSRQVWLICFNIVFAMAGLGIVAPVLPYIQDWQGASYTAMGFFVSSYAFSRMLMDLPAGIIVDRWGSGIVTVTGLAVIALGSLLSALAPGFDLLVAGRMLAGLGSGLTVASLQTELMLLAPLDFRSRAMSYFMLARRAGSSLFPFIGGLLASIGSWRSVFYFCAVLNLVVMGVALLSYRRPRPGRSDAELGVEGKEVKAGGVLPNRPVFLLLYFLSFIFFLNRNGLERTVIPFYGDALNINPLQIGLALSLTSVVSLGGIYLGGQAADRFGRKAVLLAGIAVLLLANTLFLWVDSYPRYLSASLLFGIAGFNLGLPNVIITDLVARERAGRALGAVRFFNDLGTVCGPVILAWFMDVLGFRASIYFSVAALAVSCLWTAFILPETIGKKGKMISI
ncbi:MAG: transporter, family, multidrug resistance protein [Clostridia bacterium]|nr:transporter, family, multidrug resistance protein [Clostridia bacterium]